MELKEGVVVMKSSHAVSFLITLARSLKPWFSPRLCASNEYEGQVEDEDSAMKHLVQSLRVTNGEILLAKCTNANLA